MTAPFIDLERDDIDPDVFDAAERQTIRELGPLSRRTTLAQWDRYWRRVAELASAHVNAVVGS